MKLLSRLILFHLMILAIHKIALAHGVVVRIKDAEKVREFVDEYPMIRGYEQAGHSPFVRFEIDGQFDDWLSSSLAKDDRILWFEDEEVLGVNRNHSGHGSSVAAIYDRSLSYKRNAKIFEQINFRQRASITGGVRVGIVDTGVSSLQLNLFDHIVAGQSFVDGSPSIDDSPSLADSNLNGILDEGVGHGTMVAGIILQLAPNSSLVVAKAADSDGNGTSWNVLKGAVFCVENGAKIINISLGSQTPLPGFSRFLDWVEDAGVVVVSPIGNNSSQMALFPAANSNVICVAGLLPNGTKAPFSNWDNSALVAAPATGITSAWIDGKTATWSGTSLAAPIVTGCLALALIEFPEIKPRSIRYALKVSGKEIDTINPLYKGQLGKLLDYANLVTTLRGLPKSNMLKAN